MSLLLASVLLMQGNTADETLKKIEESAALRGEISCGFEASGRLRLKGLGFQDPSRGVVMWGSRNRFSIRAAKGSAGFETNYYLISDGERAVVRKPTSLAMAFKPSGESAQAVKANWVHGGVFLGFLTVDSKGGVGGTKEVIIEAFRISDVVAEPGGTNEGALSYTLGIASRKFTAKVTLWYDSKTLLPKKRMIDSSDQEEEVKLTETYDNWSSNLPIPDSEFVIPSERYTDAFFKLPEEKK